MLSIIFQALSHLNFSEQNEYSAEAAIFQYVLVDTKKSEAGHCTICGGSDQNTVSWKS